MKRTNLLIGAVVSGLVAGSTGNLSQVKADHHDKAKAEGKDMACKGGACKGGACKGHKGKKGAKKGKKGAVTAAAPADGATAPADAATTEEK